VDRLTPRLPLLFGLGVLLHVLFAVALGQPAPAGRFQDVNVYLELAHGLWSDGAYVSLVNQRPYPPGYPLLLAPTFAIASNAARFAVVYALHAVLLGAASLLLLPMLSAALGRTRAWWSLILLQGMAGASFTLLHAQSEALYTPLLVALTGAVYLAWRRPGLRWALLAGVLAGLTLSTRRLGVVAPLGLLLVLAHDLVADSRRGQPIGWARALCILLGMALGLAPDGLAALLQGEVVNAYPKYGSTYAEAGGAALVSLANAKYAVSTAANQLAYFVLITLGAPVAMAAFLWARWRPLGSAEDARAATDQHLLATQRAAQWVGYAALGSAALTALHIVRHVFKAGSKEGFSTYPRYLDPLEIPLVVMGVLAAAALSAPELRNRAHSIVARFALLALGLAALAGPWYRTRAGRLLPLRRFTQWGMEPLGLAFFLLVSVAVLGLFWWLWRAGRAGTWVGVAAAVLASWVISAHVPIGWGLRGIKPHPPAPLLRAPAIAADPSSPLCVVVDWRSRHYYELAFRSDHEAFFVTNRQARECAVEHGGGWLVASLDSTFRPARYKVELAPDAKVIKIGRWKAWPMPVREESK